MKTFGSLSLLFVLGLLIKCSLAHSEHSFGGRSHSSHEDHVAFLGEKLAKEFDKLSPQESRRRLRYAIRYFLFGANYNIYYKQSLNSYSQTFRQQN